MQPPRGATRAPAHYAHAVLFAVSAAALAFGVPGCGAGSTPSPESTQALAVNLARSEPALADALAHSTFVSVPHGFRSEQPSDSDTVTRGGARVSAVLPRSAAGSWQLHASDDPADSFSISTLGAADVAGTLARGAVVYERAYDDVDLLMTAKASRVEQLYVLRSASAPRKLRSHVTLPEGAHADVRGNQWWVSDARGNHLIHVPEPFAVDAQGQHHPARIAWNDKTSELSVELSDDAHYTYPMLVDPAYEVESWEEISRPPPLQLATMTYDRARKEAVVFGGIDANGHLDGRTWTWNGRWTRHNSLNSPTPRTQGMMTYDTARKRVVLFGGQPPSGTFLSDTWTWDGVDWTITAPLHRPPARYGGTMTFDTVRNVALLFGGFEAPGTWTDDTWVWDGADWKKLSPAHRPGGRYLPGLAFDEMRGNAVMLGKYATASNARETWLWDGADWTLQAVATQPYQDLPLKLTYDAVRKSVVSVNANQPNNKMETWLWDGAAWTLTTPQDPLPQLFYEALTFDTDRGEILSFGGVIPNTGQLTRDVYRGNAATWKRDPSSNAPPGRNGYAISQGPANSIVLISNEFAQPQETWIWDGSNWDLRAPATRPPTRIGAQLSFDTKRNNAVLFGGTGTNGDRSDTWVWDGTDWRAKNPAQVTPARSYGHMTYDSVRERVLLFGGNTPVVSNDLWQWDGSNWTLTTPTKKPLERNVAAFTFDRSRGVAVLFGGSSFAGVLDDTWTWNGTDWSELTPTTKPAARYYSAATWDDRRGRVVLFGGVNEGGTLLNDIWGWDGKNWKSLVDPALTVLPTPRQSPGMASIAGSGQIMIQGGANATGQLSDQWIFHTRGGACSSDASCGSGHCVDGVCCEVAACGTCETCAGLDIGKCTKVINAEDPDTCSAKTGRSCDASGICQAGIGATCTQNTDCAGGHCVDGFCCNAACDLPCEACAASRKLVGSDDGRCGPAKAGTNPGGRCGENATCNAQAICETRTVASCHGNHELDVGDGSLQDCAPYLCRPGANDQAASCFKTCKSVQDCAFPATCNPDGRCEIRTLTGDDSGCAMLPSPAGASGNASERLLPFGCVLLAQLYRRRRSRVETR